MVSAKAQIAQQEKLVAETRKKIAAIKEKEAKRILRIADKVGYFDVEISDQALENVLKKLVESARASSETAIT